ncbi:MAG: DUF2332 family protein [Amaricoccus sp.]
MTEASVREVFREQARSCARMGSPFTGRVCALVADRMRAGGVVADRILGWPGDASYQGATVALRLAGGLHGLVLEGAEPALVAVYPPHEADDAALWAAISAALADHAGYLLARLDRPPQTNEPQRSAALCPGFLTVAELTGGLPLVTSELGASAGLNLSWDRFGYRFGDATWGDPGSPLQLEPDWRGPPPPLGPLGVAARASCDLTPLDATTDAGRLRLLSYVWPDQAARMERIAAAIGIARAAGITVEAADAAGWLERRLAEPHPGHVHVVYHSIIWTYLPPETQARIEASLTDAGARARPGAPLAWLRLEGGDAGNGAEISLTLWPGGETRVLGRASHHGTWVDWTGWR